jgi:orotate phosphoribosyltransferase
MLLGSYKNRMLVAECLGNIIKDNGIEFDYIAGIPTAGIAPAASLAEITKKPLIFYGKNEGFSKAFNIESLENAVHFKISFEYCRNFDLVASTCPYAIPLGVNVANEIKKPFIYVRQNKKDHGMERKIEGIVLEGQSTLLIDAFISPEESYGAGAITSIMEATKNNASIYHISIPQEKVNVSGKKLLVLEDLISTGSSSIKEVIEYRNKGAIVEDMLSIFNYGFPEVSKNFEQEKINVHSALYYSTLLKVAKETGYINIEQEALLEDWRTDAFKWGEKHGFPKDSKPL